MCVGKPKWEKTHTVLHKWGKMATLKWGDTNETVETRKMWQENTTMGSCGGSKRDNASTSGETALFSDSYMCVYTLGWYKMGVSHVVGQVIVICLRKCIHVKKKVGQSSHVAYICMYILGRVKFAYVVKLLLSRKHT